MPKMRTRAHEAMRADVAPRRIVITGTRNLCPGPLPDFREGDILARAERLFGISDGFALTCVGNASIDGDLAEYIHCFHRVSSTKRTDFYSYPHGRKSPKPARQPTYYQRPHTPSPRSLSAQQANSTQTRQIRWVVAAQPLRTDLGWMRDPSWLSH
jgi:hypothetical protein